MMRQLANPNHRVLTYTEGETFARVLHALAHPIRMQILSLLLTTPGGVRVKDMPERLAICQPTISGHLRVLVAAGLIARDKRYEPYLAVPGALDYVASFLAGDR